MLGVSVTHFGEYFKLIDHYTASTERSATRLRELGYIVRHDERLEPWQRTVLLEQLFLLQRSSQQPAKPELVHDA